MDRDKMSEEYLKWKEERDNELNAYRERIARQESELHELIEHSAILKRELLNREKVLHKELGRKRKTIF